MPSQLEKRYVLLVLFGLISFAYLFSHIFNKTVYQGVCQEPIGLSLYKGDDWHCGSNERDLPNILHMTGEENRNITLALTPGSRLGIFEAKPWSNQPTATVC